MAIHYQKNPNYSESAPDQQPKFHAKLDLQTFGISGRVERLPIFYRRLERPRGPFRVLYRTQIAGLPLESGNLQHLEVLIRDYVRALIRFETLPEYLFRVQDQAYPIYSLNGQLLTRYPGGPVFNAPEIGALRGWLAEHFKVLGRIRNRKELDLLYLSPQSLQLYAPTCMLRPETPHIEDVPVFPTQNGKGPRLLAPLNGRSLAVPFDDGLGLLELHRQAAAYFVETGSIGAAQHLTLRKIPAALWQRVADQLEKHPKALTYFHSTGNRLVRSSLDIQRWQSTCYLARGNRYGRVSVYAAGDVEVLRSLVAQAMCDQGALAHPGELQLHSHSSRHASQQRVSLLDQYLQR